MVTRNPVVVETRGASLTLWAAPDDGDDPGGTELLRFRASPAG